MGKTEKSCIENSDRIDRMTDIRVSAYSIYSSDRPEEDKVKIDAFMRGGVWADTHQKEHAKRLERMQKQLLKICDDLSKPI